MYTVRIQLKKPWYSALVHYIGATVGDTHVSLQYHAKLLAVVGARMGITAQSLRCPPVGPPAHTPELEQATQPFNSTRPVMTPLDGWTSSTIPGPAQHPPGEREKAAGVCDAG